MGYAATTIVMWGVRIEEDIAEKIYNEFSENLEDSESLIRMETVDNYLRPMTSNFRRSAAQKEYQTTPYSQHDSGCGSEIFTANIFSDNTDSRIDSLHFDPGHQHALGIYVASRGYAYTDNIEYFIDNMPQEAKDNFDKYIEPILKKYNISKKPKMILINQTW